MWQIFNVADKKQIDWKAGDVSAHVFRDAEHWSVGVSCPLSPNVAYDVVSAGDTVCFKPVFPSNPFIAFLPQKFCLAPETESCFKIVLPPELQMKIGIHGKISIPLFPLKMSFEGIDTIHGELCTVLPETAELLYAGKIEGRGVDASLFSAEAAGPSLSIFSEVIIRNRTRQVYEFDRLTVYPETMDIFEKNGSLVTDLAVMDYFETGEFRLQTSAAVPKGYQLLAEGQKDSAGSRIFRQGAGFFRDITSMKLT
jgi:hypothetical protein